MKYYFILIAILEIVDADLNYNNNNNIVYNLHKYDILYSNNNVNHLLFAKRENG